MRLEEFEKWSKDQLRNGINLCFEAAQEADDNARGDILTEVEFYMRELERRRDSRSLAVTRVSLRWID